jgi:hypothetical protein
MIQVNYPEWPRKGDLAYFDREEYVLVLDISSAAAVYSDKYESDDEGMHIWLGRDDVILNTAVLAQVLSMRGYEWLPVERLFPAVE